MSFSKPVFYRRGGTAGWEIRDWETANKLLSYLGPKVSDFAVFENPDHSYVQCAGAKRRLTVEARVYSPSGSFTHFVFGRGEPKNETEFIECSEGAIEVDANQVLQLRHARQIMRQFLEDGSFPPDFVATDVTERFKNT